MGHSLTPLSDANAWGWDSRLRSGWSAIRTTSHGTGQVEQVAHAEVGQRRAEARGCIEVRRCVCCEDPEDNLGNDPSAGGTELHAAAELRLLQEVEPERRLPAPPWVAQTGVGVGDRGELHALGHVLTGREPEPLPPEEVSLGESQDGPRCVQHHGLW